MAMAVGGSKDGPVSDPNVVPLIDVLLVLIIIFMVITPRVPTGLPTIVPQPPPPNEKQPPPDNRTIVVSVLNGGKIMINQDQSDWNMLGSRLFDNVKQTATEHIPVALILIDHDFAAVQHGNHDRAIVRRRLLLVRRRGLRNDCGQARRNSRRDHHEDDDKHEKHVDQGHYVRIRYRPVFASTNCHCHERDSLVAPRPRSSVRATCRWWGR